MRKTMITLLLAILAVAGQAQTKGRKEVVWSQVVKGYSFPSLFSDSYLKVQKVRLSAECTEVELHFHFPNGSAGMSFPIASKTILFDGQRNYALKETKGFTLGEPYIIPQSRELTFSLVFEPVPTDTKILHMAEPNTWVLPFIRNAEELPTGIDNTYWRDEATGDWLIGITTRSVIYNNKVWDITSQTERKDAYTLTLEEGTTIKVGKMKKGLRTISIGNGKPIKCSPITTAALPDYPTKDLRTGFVDNGYKTDTVTINGWLKDMPEEARKTGQEVNVLFMDFFTDNQESAFAKMDSLGRFSIKIPILNSTSVFIDLQRTSQSSILEPGKTYFFLYDFVTGQKLWMGDDARLQNELTAHEQSWDSERISGEEERKISIMEFKARTDKLLARQMQELKTRIAEHPNLSQRYIDYLTGFYRVEQGEDLLQARYSTNDVQIPQELMAYVQHEVWEKVPKPYTLFQQFSTFQRDYISQLDRNRTKAQEGNIITYLDTVLPVLRFHKKEGKVALSDEDLALLERYNNWQKEVKEGEKVDIEEWKKQSEGSKAIILRDDVKRTIEDGRRLVDLYQTLDMIDTMNCDQDLRDIVITYQYQQALDREHQPLNDAAMQYFENQVKMPAARSFVYAVQEKFRALAQKDLAKLAGHLKSGTDIANMSDGELMLRQLIEPYKGKFILLDIWGTWCGPCKAALSKSQEEYERLKDYDLVYLYLANNSPNKDWENVIKMYEVTGDNVVHYNLPSKQQSAIEHFLKVTGFPTYKLIDRDGNILDIDVDARELEKLARLLEQIK